MSAELAARHTAATAALGDFQRERKGYFDSGIVPDWQTWAMRMADQVYLLTSASPAGPALALSTSWEAILGQALADAIQYRDPAGACPDCDKHPAGLCFDHAEDLDRTDAYLSLARQLGIEVER